MFGSSEFWGLRMSPDLVGFEARAAILASSSRSRASEGRVAGMASSGIAVVIDPEGWVVTVLVFDRRPSMFRRRPRLSDLRTAITAKVLQVLLGDWDPIGVQDLPEEYRQAATDEYDAYMGPVVGMLMTDR